MIKTSTYSSLTKLVEGIKKGETAALHFVYKQHYRMVYKLVQNYNGDSQDVKDVMQETVVALYKNVVQGKYQPTAKLSTYLYKVAKNICAKRFSKRYQTGDLPESLSDDSSSTRSYQDRQERIKGYLLNDLKADCRKVLVAFYYQRLSLSEIAKEMGFTVEFAKNKKRRCMKYFRKIVQKYEN